MSMRNNKVLQESEYCECLRLGTPSIQKTVEEAKYWFDTMLLKIKEHVDISLKNKTPNTEIEFEINYHFPIIDQDICRGWHGYARGTYGYNRYGKPKCKLNQFFANPGGRFDFGPYREIWFTPIQNLIKQFVESNNN